MACEVAGRPGRRVVGEIRQGATTAIRMSGPIRTAIISFSTISPKSTPASMRSATISVRVVVDDHIQADIGRGREETWQDRHDDGRDRMLGCSDADSTGRLAAKGADGVHAGSDVFQRWAQRPQQRLARFCRRHRARGPRQEPHPEPLLQSLHGVAQCRLRHAEFGSRAGKAALLRDGGEGGEVLQVVSLHS
jgi:hypothetical protein